MPFNRPDDRSANPAAGAIVLHQRVIGVAEHVHDFAIANQREDAFGARMQMLPLPTADPPEMRAPFQGLCQIIPGRRVIGGCEIQTPVHALKELRVYFGLLLPGAIKPIPAEFR